MEDALRHSRILPLVGLLALTSSCAWYRDLERSLVEDDQKQARRAPVSREQYDQLLVKYEELSKKYEELKEGTPPGQSSLVDELQRTKPTGAETETVDIFAEQNATPVVNVPKDINSQLNLYRRAITLRSSNPTEATKIFHQLENQGIPAIRPVPSSKLVKCSLRSSSMIWRFKSLKTLSVVMLTLESSWMH